MFRAANVQATIDSLHANVALLDRDGAVISVNEGWRRFGSKRSANSDYIGLNYLEVCAGAAEIGDRSAIRVLRGLKRLLAGQSDSYGTAYPCAERIYRLSARRIGIPDGGVIVAHQDITALVNARRERASKRIELQSVHEAHAGRIAQAHEELAQRLTAITLATSALEQGGDIADAVTLIKLAVEEARQELKLLRYDSLQPLPDISLAP
ncbi:hypothetical protein [Sphingomonas alba]|uniref:PAS fold-4 domain-containing protein n=1 Tax=Sphingomonas alba TaxID=2908208 RepID=A0ABT0RPT6_9SPHN|nr:hypothetical protein [Sphingomonas alba]MCL6684610.1 hypothetical protein [Sphingomonas alba]